MGEVVVLREMVTRLSQDTLQLAPERTMLDLLDLAYELDLAVPDFHRRKFCQAAHSAAVGLDRGRRDRPRPLFREIRRRSGDREARRQPLEIRREIHAGQGLVEIVDV